MARYKESLVPIPAVKKRIESLSDLLPDPRNARKHTPRNVQTIVDAIHEVGAARSGVIDENGVILAGNATAEALAEAGIEKVKVVEADGNEWVVVQRKGLSEEQKARLALYDNRAAEHAEWNPEVLKELEQINLLDGLFTAEELEKLLNNVELIPEPEQAEPKEKKEVTCPSCGERFIP